MVQGHILSGECFPFLHSFPISYSLLPIQGVGLSALLIDKDEIPLSESKPGRFHGVTASRNKRVSDRHQRYSGHFSFFR